MMDILPLSSNHLFHSMATCPRATVCIRPGVILGYCAIAIGPGFTCQLKPHIKAFDRLTLRHFKGFHAWLRILVTLRLDEHRRSRHVSFVDTWHSFLAVTFGHHIAHSHTYLISAARQCEADRRSHTISNTEYPVAEALRVTHHSLMLRSSYYFVAVQSPVVVEHTV